MLLHASTCIHRSWQPKIQEFSQGYRNSAKDLLKIQQVEGTACQGLASKGGDVLPFRLDLLTPQAGSAVQLYQASGCVQPCGRAQEPCRRSKAVHLCD